MTCHGIEHRYHYLDNLITLGLSDSCASGNMGLTVGKDAHHLHV
jgi:hypothetical protein